MLAEEAVPLNERFLFTTGIVSAKTLAIVGDGFSIAPSPNGRILFFSFAYADLALGNAFSFVFPRKRPQDAVETEAVITAVTQQWGKPFDDLPHGWKTISLVEFPRGVPALIDALPIVDHWYESAVSVCLANQDTVSALRLVATAKTV